MIFIKSKLLIVLLSLILITGCQKNSKDNIVKRLEKKIDGQSYLLTGDMKIISNEEHFEYELNVISEKNTNYLVKLVNSSNNHEQIILKNSEGVYVITPSLNKSFKFQSEWPNNGSQSYILESLLKDIQNDNEKIIEEKDKNIIIKCKVDYPNNPDLEYEKIIIDESGNINKITVYDSNDAEKIIVSIDDIDYKSKINKDTFKIDNYINNENICEEEDCSKKTMNGIEEIIYPLYVPNNTYLNQSEKIEDENNQKVILTFNGEKDLVIVEEAVSIPQQHEIVSVNGDPYIIPESIAVANENSLYFINEGINYYLASSKLNKAEMLTIAESLSNSIAVSQSK